MCSVMAKTSWKSFSISLLFFFVAFPNVSSDERLVRLNGMKYSANGTMNEPGSHLVFEEKTIQQPLKNLSQSVLKIELQDTEASVTKSTPGFVEESEQKPITGDEDIATNGKVTLKDSTDYVIKSHGDDVSDDDDDDDDNGDDVQIKDDAEYHIMESLEDDIDNDDTDSNGGNAPIKVDEDYRVMESHDSDTGDGMDYNLGKEADEYFIMESLGGDVSDNEGDAVEDNDEPVQDDDDYYVIKSQEGDVNDGSDNNDEDGLNEDKEYRGPTNGNVEDNGQDDDRYGDDDRYDDDDGNKGKGSIDDEAYIHSMLSFKEVHKNNRAMISVYAWIALVGFISIAGFLVVLRGRHLLNKLFGGRQRHNDYRTEDEKPLMA